ncbi:MAG: type II toxin-antitoxin system HicA family toxin [Chloroflexi bacterium]|nr:type II toxin-antitoxin system HicA family toxin [Chloroflexota bacterium]MYE32574.1 type II toxin-antitoxin system HicA family toxin [Chloroflexota bacterium]
MPPKSLTEIARSPAGTTRRELVRALRDAGWSLRREGARHEIWAKAVGRVMVPRHRGDLAPGTVRTIARDALSEGESYDR